MRKVVIDITPNVGNDDGNTINDRVLLLTLLVGAVQYTLSDLIMVLFYDAGQDQWMHLIPFQTAAGAYRPQGLKMDAAQGLLNPQ